MKYISVLFTVFFVSVNTGLAQDAETIERYFSAYPVGQKISQTERPPLQMTEDAYRFRTRIRQAYKGDINFAGQFILTSWGCGTGCQSYGIINVETGRAWLLSLVTSLGIEYRKASRLLIANPSYEEEDIAERPDYAKPQFYKFTSDSLQLILPAELEALRND